MGNFNYTISIGQLGEQLTLNQRVPGSSPRWCTKKETSDMRRGFQPVEKGHRKVAFFSYRGRKCGIMVWGDKNVGAFFDVFRGSNSIGTLMRVTGMRS